MIGFFAAEDGEFVKAIVPEALGRHALYYGDCLDWMRSLPGCSVDSVVTDPPYFIRFKSLAFDTVSGGAAQQAWHTAWLAEALRVLQPGGHLVACGSTRTSHHLACAAENAGFELRDSLHWIYAAGWPKSATVLAPSVEPILLARKPCAGTAAANMIAYGTGALNIDACRTATGDALTIHSRSQAAADASALFKGNTALVTHQTAGQAIGRWPKNVLMDEAVAQAFDEREGERTSGAFSPVTRANRNGYAGPTSAVSTYSAEQSTGGPSRYFPVLPVDDEETLWPLHFSGKITTAERAGTAHPTTKPLALMCWLARLVTPPGGTILEPFGGSGTTILAAEKEGFTCLASEQDEQYAQMIRQRWEKREELFAALDKKEQAKARKLTKAKKVDGASA